MCVTPQTGGERQARLDVEGEVGLRGRPFGDVALNQVTCSHVENAHLTIQVHVCVHVPLRWHFRTLQCLVCVCVRVCACVDTDLRSVLIDDHEDLVAAFALCRSYVSCECWRRGV